MEEIQKLVLRKALSYDEIKGRYLYWKNGLISKDGFIEQITHLLERSLEPSTKPYNYITTNLPAHYKFHDDQISNEEVVVKSFPYMNVFGDFRLFNGLTLREFDDALARLVPIFCELKKMRE